MQRSNITRHWTLISATVLTIMILSGVAAFAETGQMPAALMAIAVDPDQAQPFELTARVMETRQGPPATIVVAERTILITAYRVMGEDDIQETELLGQDGQAIGLNDFDIGDRVTVSGLELSGDIMVGLQIQILTNAD